MSLIPLLPLLLLEIETGSTGDWGKGPFPSLAAGSYVLLPSLRLPVCGADIYSPASIAPQVKKDIKPWYSCP